MAAKTVFVLDTDSMTITGVIPAGHKMLDDLEPGQAVFTHPDVLLEMTGPQLVKLYNQYAETSIKKFDTKAKGVERVWALLNSDKVSFTVITPAEEVKIQEAAATIPSVPAIDVAPGVPGVKKLRKVRDSKFKRLIAMFQTGNEYTLDQLSEGSGFTEASVFVRISVLRSDTHEWKMNIVKHKDRDTWQLYNQDGSLYHVKHAHRAVSREEVAANGQ